MLHPLSTLFFRLIYSRQLPLRVRVLLRLVRLWWVRLSLRSVWSRMRRARLFTLLLASSFAVLCVPMPAEAYPIVPDVTYRSSLSPEPSQVFVTGNYEMPVIERDSFTTSWIPLEEAKKDGWVQPQGGELPKVFEDALALVGTPYVAYAESPKSGFDCSGFTRYVWGLNGVDLFHSARVQMEEGHVIPESQARLGDLVYMSGHIGFWAGPGWILDSPKPGGTVSLRRLWTDAVKIVRVDG
jgi:hypothetical protein